MCSGRWTDGAPATGPTAARLPGSCARPPPTCPPRPAFVDPPWLWGSEQHVRGLFAGTGIELEFERGVAEFPPFDSVDDDVEYHSARFGPLLAARAATEADGRWPELRSRLRELHEGLTSAEYLLVVGRKAARGRRRSAGDRVDELPGG